MIVRLVVFADRPLAHMTDQSVAGHFKLTQAQSSAFDFQVFEKCIGDIRDEISFPNIDHTAYVTFLADCEIIFFAKEPVRKAVRTVKNKIGIAINIERQRRIGYRKEPYRLARAVDQS